MDSITNQNGVKITKISSKVYVLSYSNEEVELVYQTSYNELKRQELEEITGIDLYMLVNNI